MKKWIWISVSLIVLIGSIVLVVQNSLAEKENERELVRTSVEDYLYDVKGYTKEEIKSIEITESNGSGLYYRTYAYVIYSDEPVTEYIYFVRNDNQQVEHGGFANMPFGSKPTHE